MTTRTNLNEAVILLHGLCRSRRSMFQMESVFKNEGFHVINTGYPSRTDNIENLSIKTFKALFNSFNLESFFKVHFVTHSMGGILVRFYLKKNKIKNLGRVVMLAPPNGGSEVVDRLRKRWFFKMLNGPAGNELGTDKDSVPNILGPVDFELGIIAGDRTINFINSFLFISGRDDGKVSIEKTKITGMKEHITLHTAHPFIMKNAKSIHHTVNFIKSGSFFT